MALRLEKDKRCFVCGVENPHSLKVKVERDGANQVKAEFVGHSYFYTSPAVSSDLILLLRDNRDPGSSNGRPLIQLGNNFWQIQDGYPYISSD